MDTVIIVFLISLGFLVAFLGIAGSILPFLPGPLISFLSLLIISFAKDWQPFSVTVLAVIGAASVLVMIIDNFIPSIGAGRYGASKMGIAGSLIGMIVGFFVLSAFGVIIGAFLGAVLGELLSGKNTNLALRAGWGSFMGNLAGIAIKLAYSIFVLFLNIRALW